MFLSVVIPTYNPHIGRLTRTLSGLYSQTLATNRWELVIIDNASQDPDSFSSFDLSWHPLARVVREEKLGLTSARLRGFAETSGDIIVLVDDDNVLAPDYLEIVMKAFAADNSLGATGGRSLPEFESTPPGWLREFDGLLALRNLGDTTLHSIWTGDTPRTYPSCAPIGAGLALRRCGAVAYVEALAQDVRRLAFDRTGSQLISGGDNDLVMTVLETGLAVTYLPSLQLTHLISKGRLQRKHLGSLNRAIARSWVQVLSLHGIQPWKPIGRATVPLRQMRSWVRSKAWSGPAEWVRWQGACGHFEGLADINTRAT